MGGICGWVGGGWMDGDLLASIHRIAHIQKDPCYLRLHPVTHQLSFVSDCVRDLRRRCSAEENNQCTSGPGRCTPGWEATQISTFQNCHNTVDHESAPNPTALEATKWVKCVFFTCISTVCILILRLVNLCNGFLNTWWHIFAALLTRFRLRAEKSSLLFYR